MSGATTAMVTVGTRLIHDGQPMTVVGVDAGRLRLRGPRGEVLLVDTAVLFADQGTRVVGVGEEPVEALGPLLDNLTVEAAAQMRERLGHVRELLTGYRSGSAETAAPGEPRPAYRPGLPLMQRYLAKSAEIGVTVRTLQRWAAGWRERGPVGVLDGRHLRVADPLGGVDERWLAMCRLVLDEHVDASRPTRKLLLARVQARLVAEYGHGVVPVPGMRRAAAVLAELTRGTNALIGSTKGKRSIAARPKGVYGRLRPTRPGEYVLLDSTPLDVFAMELLTLRWVSVELTVACARLVNDRTSDFVVSPEVKSGLASFVRTENGHQVLASSGTTRPSRCDRCRRGVAPVVDLHGAPVLDNAMPSNAAWC